MPRDYHQIPKFQSITEEEWSSYHWQLRNRLTTAEDLAGVLNLRADERADLAKCFARFRVAITPYYASLMDPDDAGCPVRRQAIPSVQELEQRPEDMHDPVAEDFDSPTPRITHRYPDRVLFLLTEMCSMYCRHCTRRRLVGGTETMVSGEDIANAITYIERSPEVRDILISGGDPLVLSDRQIEDVVSRLRRIDHVEVVRIGSRTPVVLPQRITPELVSMLRKYHPIWLNTHFNHPKELTPESRRACEMLVDAGIPVGNQSVLLRGVNDDPMVMKKLVQGLVKYRVRPYYIFQCDLSEGIGHHRVPISKGIEIMENLRGHTSGYCIPTYALEASDGGGKIPLGPQYVLAQSPNRWILRNYEGVISQYTDPSDYEESKVQDSRWRCNERAVQGVASLFRGPKATLNDVNERRLAKVRERKARMSRTDSIATH